MGDHPLGGAGLEVAQREPGRVAEHLHGGLAKCLVLVGNACLVERGLLRRFEDGVRDSPDEVGDPIELALFQDTPSMS
jgi:hypothetical protein